jgi:DNA-binding CsgD family transcriptional regulator
MAASEVNVFLNQDNIQIENTQAKSDKTILISIRNPSVLSNQEIKIIQLICQEKTSREIAQFLNLTLKGVEFNRMRILSKIKARNMIGIVLYAIKHSFFEILEFGSHDSLGNRVLIKSFDNSLLSGQEIKIVRLICQQKTSQEIADILFVSKKTIDTHRNRIFKKVNAINMVGVAIYAVKHKLVMFS